jgi:hypothetical protein
MALLMKTGGEIPCSTIHVGQSDRGEQIQGGTVDNS